MDEFARKIFGQFLEPLDYDEIESFSTYLAEMKKPQAFKDMVLDKHLNRMSDFAKTGLRMCSSFIKDEGYMTWKHARTINGFSKKTFNWDAMSYYSRIIKSIEKKVYGRLPGLVKHMTPHERAKMVQELGDHYVKSICDYSSYEASFTKGKMASVQFVLYDYMLSNFPKVTSQAIKDLISGKNVLDQRFFLFTIMARKMSGDPDTALSNAIDNWMDWIYLMYRAGIPAEQAATWMLIEGDDNASCLNNIILKKEQFEKLGLKAKLETNLELESTGFCQLYVGAAHRERVVICKDPYKILANFSKIPAKYGRANKKVLDSLYRGMAKGILYQHAGAPVASVLATKMLEQTKGVNVRNNHWKDVLGYHADQEAVKNANWRELSEVPIAMEDRILVESQFGMTVEMQLHIEDLIRKWDSGPLKLPVEWFPEPWWVFSDNYVVQGSLDSWVEGPTAARKGAIAACEKVINNGDS